MFVLSVIICDALDSGVRECRSLSSAPISAEACAAKRAQAAEILAGRDPRISAEVACRAIGDPA